MELMDTFRVFVLWIENQNEARISLHQQWNKLVKAIHLFMLDIDVLEFNDLKLPSEKKEKKQEEPKSKTKLKGIKKKAKQLTLFFVKKGKKLLLYLLLGIELVVETSKDMLVKNEPDFENRYKH
jgi:hypothetical protein